MNPFLATRALGIVSMLLLAACGDGHDGSGSSGGNSAGPNPTAPNNPTASTFTVGGTVTGLNGSGLVLQNNGGDNLAISANGGFTFATAVVTGGGYTVTVLTPPSNPDQTCGVANAAGTVAGGAVSNIVITCSIGSSNNWGTLIWDQGNWG